MGLPRNKAGVVLSGCILLLAIVIWLVSASRQQKPLPDSVYVYDVSTGLLSSIAASENPSDGKYRAYVFSCGSCSPDEWRVTYITDLQSATGSGVSESSSVYAVGANRSHRIAQPPPAGGQPKWLPSDDMEAQKLTTNYLRMCDGNRATQCTP